MNKRNVDMLIKDSNINKKVFLVRYDGSAQQRRLIYRPTFSGAITHHERVSQNDYARAAVLIEKEFVYGVQSEVMKRLIGEAKYDAFILSLTTACFDDSHLAARRKLLKRLLRVPLLPTIAELQ